jgi:hypothetical protein
MPGTRLHTRFRQEGKLIRDRWWTDPRYRYGAVMFRPKTLSPETVALLCTKARHAFYSLTSIARRSLLLLQRSRDPLLFCYFWRLNLLLGKEVAQKMGLPLGDNLDETPK